MKLYGAFDLHSSNNYLAIIDEQDKRLFKKKLHNDPGIILGELERFRADITGLVVESTYNWGWWTLSWQKAIRFIWPILQPSRSTRGSNTAMTTTMPSDWLTCCGWEYCRRVTYIQKTRGRYGICCGSVDISCNCGHL